MLSGNKGEWSEIYALLKVVGDKILLPGDSDMNLLKNIEYPVVSVLRDETGGNFNFSYDQETVLITKGEEVYRVAIAEFRNHARQLLQRIKAASTSTFQIEETEAFIRSFSCNSIKAASSAKSDIRIMIHDARTGQAPILGFSIKSQLGGASTLLNAGHTTNFVYRIDDCRFTQDEIHQINTINTSNKIRDRISAITQKQGRLTFTKTENPVFSSNLVLIDSFLPFILGKVLLNSYVLGLSSVEKLVKTLNSENPLGYDISNHHPFYEYKMKRFLTDIALGMMPSKVWKGELDATGGYLIVKETGDIVCYHIYNRNEFEDYLLHNTKLETASSTRHGFGTIYEENGTQYFKLNLQIRFIR